MIREGRRVGDHDWGRRHAVPPILLMHFDERFDGVIARRHGLE